MMNILHLRASNCYGGPERQIHAHAKAALPSEYKIILASFAENGRTPEFIRTVSKDGIRTHVFRVTSPYDTDVVYRINRFLYSNAIDIICTHDYRSHVLAALTALRYQPSAKWIAFSRGKTRETVKTQFFQIVADLLTRFASHIVAVSQSEKKRLVHQFISRERVSVVPNAILKSESNSTVLQADLRQKFSFANDTLIAIAAGRFSPEKGQYYLVEAAKIVRQHHSEFRFALYGNGPERNNIAREVQNADISDIVVCPGFESNIQSCLLDADVVVNPSITEAMPNIVLEAIALNKPIVATAVGGVPDVVSDGVNGLLVPPGNSQRLAEALLKVGANLEEFKRTSRALDAELCKQYAVSKQFDSLCKVYESVVR